MLGSLRLDEDASSTHLELEGILPWLKFSHPRCVLHVSRVFINFVRMSSVNLVVSLLGVSGCAELLA